MMASFSPSTPTPGFCSPPGVDRAAFLVPGSPRFHFQPGVLWHCTPPPRHSHQGWDAQGGPGSGLGRVGAGEVGVGGVAAEEEEVVEAG